MENKKLQKALIYGIPIVIAFFILSKLVRGGDKGNRFLIKGDDDNKIDPSVFPLKLGSKGEEVKQLQSMLESLKSEIVGDLLKSSRKYNKEKTDYTFDGDFGTDTEKAVVKVFNKKEVSIDDFKKLKYESDNANKNYEELIKEINKKSVIEANDVLKKLKSSPLMGLYLKTDSPLIPYKDKELKNRLKVRQFKRGQKLKLDSNSPNEIITISDLSYLLFKIEGLYYPIRGNEVYVQ